jgi:signal peptidase I
MIQTLTAAVLAAFVAYAGAWYMGWHEGNFALLLMMATFVSGLYWLAERFYFLPQRQQALALLETQMQAREAELSKQGISYSGGDALEDVKSRLIMQPWWLDWTAGLFPVILLVFVLRSFLFEPFKIPSGSMIPTLLVGDLILVNKYHYGLRLPVFNIKLTQGEAPQRGDVMVFRYPPKPSQDYIKRIVGVPGDEVAYLNKKLSINGQAIDKSELPDFFEEDAMRYFKQFGETLGAHKHRILNDSDRPAYVAGASDFAFRQNCRYSIEGVICKVPEGHYFMMGDNRDNSLDSRYWGFVPDQNIVGKAILIWMNFGHIQRLGRIE